MERRVADHALLADPPLADLELRLDQGDQLGLRRRQRQGRGQQSLQPDEAGVADDEGRRLRYLRAAEAAGVGPLQHHDPRVLTQLPGELALADVHGVDLGRAARQKDICEAAGGGADVQADPVLGIDPEVIQALLQLQAAA